jgi:DNA-binding GntR family transcriptional regulator
MARVRQRRLREVRGESLADQARERIRAAVLEGALRPGERLTIEELAAELGVSRTPVREALKALEGDGLVRLLPYRGAVVESVAREELSHRYTIRAMLEGYAAELACAAEAPRLARELERNCDELAAAAESAAAGDLARARRLAELNARFHDLIREASGSRTLARLLDTLRNPVAYTLSYWSEPARRGVSIECHRAIAGAFRAGRPRDARRLMEQHLLTARDEVLSADGAPASLPRERRTV